MIGRGDVLENPTTGEVLVCRESGAETQGERVVFESVLPPGGFSPAHVHIEHTERLEVLSGVLAVGVGATLEELGPGDSVTIEPRTAHAFWNRHAHPVRFVGEVRPARAFESIVESTFRLVTGPNVGAAYS
jgi:quercetin dioxygenase-like cupin family protein